MAAVQQAPLLVQYEREEMMFENDEYEDLGELSDSPSSKPSSSRCHTPPLVSLASASKALNAKQHESTQPLALAAKAERILGLIPGTLNHARAALESARDEVRRTSDTSAPFGSYVAVPPSTSTSSSSDQQGLKGKMARARKAMSVSLGSMPNVVIGIGGKEELLSRERRRRAVDGVLYWQREVERLEALDKATTVGPTHSKR